jgi:uncharacterized protein (TIGR00290 family)
MAIPAAVCWSGGKDCALAVHVAVEQGYRPSVLVTAFDETGERSRSHAMPAALIESQAAALGMRLVKLNTSWATYEERMIGAMRGLAAEGVTSVIFGDIDMEPHREWEERVCALAGLNAHLPIWRRPRRELAQEVLSRGIEAIVVATADAMIDPAFCGRRYDQRFIDDLPASVDICGENGEFHSFVTNAPLFRAPVNVTVARIYQNESVFAGKSYFHHHAALIAAN